MAGRRVGGVSKRCHLQRYQLLADSTSMTRFLHRCPRSGGLAPQEQPVFATNGLVTEGSFGDVVTEASDVEQRMILPTGRPLNKGRRRFAVGEPCGHALLADEAREPYASSSQYCAKCRRTLRRQMAPTIVNIGKPRSKTQERTVAARCDIKRLCMSFSLPNAGSLPHAQGDSAWMPNSGRVGRPLSTWQVEVCFPCLPPGFPWWCHNISTIVNWGAPPPRTGRAPLTHPAPHGYFPAAHCCVLHAGPVIIECPALSPVDALSNLR